MRAPTPLSAARWLLDGTLIVLVAVLFAAVVVSRILPALGHETVTIIGRSMEPTIPIGSAIVLEHVAPQAVATGDVVTVTIPERRITYTHRVVELIDRSDGRWLRTRGDANDAADPGLVRADWVVGRLDVTLPGLGMLLRLLSAPSGMLAVLGLALTLFVSARLIEELEGESEAERRRPVRPAFARPRRAREADPGARPVTSSTAPAAVGAQVTVRVRARSSVDAATRAAIRARMLARSRPPVKRAARS
jgi:signal peptidase